MLRFGQRSLAYRGCVVMTGGVVDDVRTRINVSYGMANIEYEALQTIVFPNNLWTIGFEVIIGANSCSLLL